MPSFSSAHIPARRTGLLAAASALLSGCSSVRIIDTLVAAPRLHGQHPHRLRSRSAPEARCVPAGVGYWRLAAPAGGALPWGLLDLWGACRLPLRRRGAGSARHRGGGRLPAQPAVRYPAFVEDCAVALRSAADHARDLGSDAARLVPLGHSAGAYNAAMLALDPRWLGAVGLAPGRRARC